VQLIDTDDGLQNRSHAVREESVIAEALCMMTCQRQPSF